jgi:nicotinamide mononucleotide transporter
MDSLTTALSITATWMLAKKIIEHWLIWIFVDLLSAGLYIYKELWPTVILFLIYTFMALIGYLEWKKHLSVEK